MEQLADQQELHAEEISNIIRNYKKDPADRKASRKYFEERLRRLDAAWALFEKTDTTIRSSPQPPTDHVYFTSGLYDLTFENYNKFREHFLEKIASFSTETNPNNPPLSKEINQGDNNQSNASIKPTPHPSKDNQSLAAQPTELIRLVRRHRGIAESLRRTLSSLDLEDQQHPRQFYELKIKTINQYWAQLESLNHDIWELSDDPTTEGHNIDDYIQLEEIVQTWLIRLSANLHNLTVVAPNMTTASTATPSVATTMLKLPKITLPRFDGDYLKWRQFYDLFVQMVHNQPMVNCQKMWYLKTNLTGDAEKLIRHFATSDDNYLAAWKTLKDRYDNPRLLVAALVNKLLSQPTHASDKASATAIRALHDTTQECLMGLENLGVSTTSWDPLLLHMLIKKLDRDTHTLYEQSLSNPRSLQSIKDFLAFLETRFQSLEALGNKGKGVEEQRRPNSIRSVSATSTTAACPVCKGNHALYACKNFLQMTPSHRLNLLRKHSLCINCLRDGHQAAKCSLRGCTKCSKKHNSLVHLEALPPKVAHDSSISEKLKPIGSTASVAIQSDDQYLSLTTLSHQRRHGYVLLSTARVKLAANNGESIECRAILDSGSQINLITERMIKRLGISYTHDSMFIEGIGRAAQRTQKRVNVLLESRINGFSTRVEAFVLPKIISPQPTQPIDTSSWAIPKNIKLADPTFSCPDHIDLLLGAEFYHEFLSVGQIKLDTGMPILQNTVFGWILAGKISQPSAATATCGIGSEDQRLSEIIEKFWKIEDYERSQKVFTTAEKRCETLFNQTVQQDNNKRFVVRLPFAEDPSQLGESKSIALRRFYSLERKLAKNSELKQQYQQFMDEYLKLGHMEEIDFQEIPSPHYFLPHHCVLKPDSSTTKLRVVFDASSKTSSNISLNDILYAGPTIQDDLFTILLRFRLPRFVFTADIQKMYRQVLVHDEDRRYQLIMWRKEPTELIKYYKLNTVTYGTTSAPYLATKCLQKLSQAGIKNYPLGSAALRRDFYVDDVMTGSNSLSIAAEMQKQLISLLQEAGFKLRKWCANHPQLLQGFLPEDKEVQLDFKNDTEDHIKTLGLTWLPKSNNFCIKTNWDHENKVTKRIVSSDIARLFDPLGIMAPVIITAKIFLQQLWHLKLDWDAALPQELHTKWSKFRDNLKALNHIQFPRHVFAQKVPEIMQFHIFADASEKAFGAAIYIRSVVSPGRVIVRLLCAKSRVAPIQKLTLPRLELCAAKLAADLAKRVKTDLGIEEAVTYFWTDSEIVLAWINSSSASFHTFVANRVSSIQSSSTPQQWRHVRSKENPADLLSRGIAPERLSDCNLWFYGPLFLHGQESAWPQPYTKTSACDLEKLEKRKTALPMVTSSADNTSHFIYGIHHGNSFKKLQRVTAYVMRFIRLLRKHDVSVTKYSTLSSQELTDALYTIVKTIQEEEFKDDIAQLKRYKECKKNSPLSSLTPFLDDRNILRVGGRLEASTLPYAAKHPILLPYGHPTTKMIMTDIHHENLHVGPQTLLSITRQRFWPIKGKTIARSIVQNCVRCARAKPKLLSQVMGNLPSTRVQPARPFVNSGVDFCGPIQIHYRGRGSRPQKGYIAVFCCFATKAIHLEVVSALSTEAFLGALRRFIGRRGHVRNLYCDNATNFVGARNQLQELTQAIYSNQARDSITSSCSKRGIDFHFIPPRAPHFGGLWEAAVKSAKHLLQRSVSSAILTYEELETLMVEIEAVLNSRPLTQMSSNPNDITALTPGHFLIGEPLTAMIDSGAEPNRANLLTRWKLVTHIKNEFWRRWSREYLNGLQHRFKWKQRNYNLKPGDIVIIKEDNMPPLKWALGRVIETHKGEDGYVRVADIRTSSGVLRRAIHKLAPLPCEDETSEQNPALSREDEVVRHPEQHTKRKAEEPTSSVRQTPMDSDDIPKRKIRKTYGSAIASLLLTCLILPVIKAAPVEVNQFSSQPGLHFEALGTVSLASNEWNLVVYYDLNPYWLEYSTLVNGTSTLEHLCNLIAHKSSCTPIVNQFNHILDEVTRDNELLVTDNNITRKKRGAFNIVGNIANSLFGVLDSEYAQEMSKTIDNIKGNEDHLLLLLKNQTSIIDSTLNIIKGDQMAVQEKFKTLDNQLNQIINRLNDDNQTKLTSVFSSLSIQMTLIVSNLQRIQSSIINVIIDTNHGKINPLLLSPQQLKKEFMIIRSHTPSYLRLPVEQDGLLQIYKLMTMKGRIVNNHIIFQIKIPLVNIEVFDLFRILPIPISSNDTFIAIEPDSEYLIISPHRDQYYPLLEQELASCILTGTSTHLCEQSKPLYRKGANVSICEVDLLNNMPLSSHCKLIKIDNSQIWTRLTHPNEWIYALKARKSINVVCGNDVTTISLEGSGLLKLQANCVIKLDLLTIQGHHVYLSNARTSYTKLGSLTDIVPSKTMLPGAINSLPYEASLNKIDQLKERARVQLLAELPHRITNHDLHQFTVGYIGLALTIAIIIFWLWRYRRSSAPTNKEVPSAPEPLPRRHRQYSLPTEHEEVERTVQRGGEC